MENLDKSEVWDAIHLLSDIRAQYDVFDKAEHEKYHACSLAIQALKFNSRAKELLEATIKLLNKQNESPYVLNLLDELVYYDECECDGNCLLEDIEILLTHGE